MRPQNSFLQFSQKILLYPKKLFNIKIFSIQFSIKKVIFIFSVRWPLLLKNNHVPQKFFPPFSPKMLLFLKKLLDEKIFKTSFSIKKVIFIFVARCPLPFKRDLDLINGFLSFSPKIQIFLKKPLCNKIFRTTFVIKKVILIFGAGRLLSLKEIVKCTPKTVFLRFSRKVMLFSKKLLNKKIFSV